MSAQLIISVSGVNPTMGELMSIPLHAIVGVARLHVPRALQVCEHNSIVRLINQWVWLLPLLITY